MESHARSLAKAISYRFLGSAITALIVFMVTGKMGISGRLGLSLAAGAADMVLKIGAYFIHERIWEHVDFGRPKPPEYEI